MAMRLTTTKYCCRNASNLRRPIPPISMCRQSKVICSALYASPWRPSMYLPKAASEIRSSPGETICMKRFSKERLFCCISFRSNPEMSAHRASTMLWHFARTEAMAVAHCFFTATLFPSIFCKSLFASIIAPLRGVFGSALGTFSSCSATEALASSMLLVVASRSFSASSKIATGVAKASRSAPLKETRGLDASSSPFAAASIASTLAAAGPVMASASFRSRASMWAFFSANSFLA
mmetsp:Transcript_119222/g.299818  ORF Transcript_119222/g.299818 Transcript_119222/m.299818 type:complete len:236 (+) Transcript_119222:1156-1863(+)